MQPPGIQINQLMCTEVPGDEPIVQFINILDPLKMPAGTTVTKRNTLLKMQVTINSFLNIWNCCFFYFKVTNACHSTIKGSLARIEVFKHPDDTHPLWETYLGNY